MAGEGEEGLVGGEEAFMANEESAELTEPCVGSFDDPAAFISPQFSTVLISPQLVFAVRNDEVNDALGEPLAQRVGVIGAVGDHALRLLSRAAFGAWDFAAASVASASVASPG